MGLRASAIAAGSRQRLGLMVATKGGSGCLGACIDRRAAQSAERHRNRLVTGGRCDR